MMRYLPAMLLAAALPLSAAADVEKLLADTYDLADGALAVVKCTYASETGEQEVAGLAVCYDAENGELLTLALGGQMNPAGIRDLRLELPGPEHRTIPAELLGIRPEVGLGFVKASAPHAWQAVRFAGSSDLAIGQAVASAALMPGDAANTPQVGLAYVAALRRIPERVYMVTGGGLTGVGSPVFAADGRAVGLVTRSIFLDYQMATQQGTGNVALAGLQESVAFLPAEEFAFALQDIPRGGTVRRPRWLGVLRVSPVAPDQAQAMGLAGPGAEIDGIVPDSAAEQAGLTGGDVIVALNGQPLERLATGELSVRNMMRLLNRIEGDSVDLTLRRGEETLDVTLPLEEMPTLPEEAPRYVSRELGMLLRERVRLDRYIGETPAADTQGMQVLAVGPESPAAAAGLAAGDIVTSVDGQPVQSAVVLRQIVETHLAERPGEAILLLVRRGGQEPQAISITPPLAQQ